VKDAADAAAGAAPLLDMIDVLTRDSGQHLLTGPAHEDDIASLERALGLRLPASFRLYLARMGSGILYDRHEVFGPHSLQLHDIEFIPSLTGLLRQLRPAPGPGLVPFHRVLGRVHAFDLGGGPAEPVPVRALDGSASYPDLASFLEAVVVPRSL
jgi:hypothetical protein